MDDVIDIPVEEGFLLVEGWMLGAAMFAEAMAEVIRVPPANDLEPAPKG
jgi:hypothetical protein